MNLYLVTSHTSLLQTSFRRCQSYVVRIVLPHINTSCGQNEPFAKLRKATIRFVMPVRPQGTTDLPQDGFSWNLTLSILRKCVEKIQVTLKDDKSNWYFTWRRCTFMISRLLLLRKRNVIDKSSIENQNTRFMFSNFFPENLSVYQTNEDKYGRARPGTWQYTTARARRMLDNNVTDTHSEYVIDVFIAFPWQHWLRERASVLRYSRLPFVFTIRPASNLVTTVWRVKQLLLYCRIERGLWASSWLWSTRKWR
jgi:hypothetical protein